MATEKKTIVSEFSSSTCEVAYFGECKWLLRPSSEERKSSVKILIVKRKKLQKTDRKKITTLTGMKSNLLIEKAG